MDDAITGEFQEAGVATARWPGVPGRPTRLGGGASFITMRQEPVDLMAAPPIRDPVQDDAGSPITPSAWMPRLGPPDPASPPTPTCSRRGKSRPIHSSPGPCVRAGSAPSRAPGAQPVIARVARRRPRGHSEAIFATTGARHRAALEHLPPQPPHLGRAAEPI